MDSKRLTNVLTRHIPRELCGEILSRLPVKSLHRFRCVSKSWISLINDPDFFHLHLHNYKNNRDETHLFVVEGGQRDCVVRCSDTFESSTTTLRSLGPEYTQGYWRILCSVDGLFLLKKGYQSDLVVWNPSIRKFHDIPSLPEIDSYFDEVVIGLGYDPLVKDYKFAKVIRENANVPPWVAIYTLGAGSWKSVEFKGNWDYGYIYGREVVYLRGSLYFLSTHRELGLLELASFDLSSEMFCLITNKVPDDITAYLCPNDYSPRFGKGLRLVRYGGSSLAMFDLEYELFVWVWDSESMCWIKPYSLDSRVHKFLYLKKNRDILMGWLLREMSFTLFTSKRLVQHRGMVSSYNLETREEKLLFLLKENAYLEIYDVYGYIESLFPLK